jgi:glyoxylase-like metal-dependent hydrolase (beta-lactamase superfamily II)
VHWFWTGLPFELGTVNQWLLRDHDGWTMVDCGFPTTSAQAQIEAIWSKTLEGLPITRLVVTHHHLDHAGNCRWICERWGILPSMTDTAYHEAQINLGPVWKEQAPQRLAFLLRHGVTAAIGGEIDRIWGQGRKQVAQLPEYRHSLKEGDAFRIMGNEWRVIVVEGHAPGQALLYAPAMDLLIAGDQILSSISPNVSYLTDRPDATPLAEFLNSNRRIAQACGDVLVLPSHGTPFRGLHARIQELESHHAQRLKAVEDALVSGPHTAADLLPSVFDRQLSGFDVALALGETIAHLHYLVDQGRAYRVDQNGLVLFSALPHP